MDNQILLQIKYNSFKLRLDKELDSKFTQFDELVCQIKTAKIEPTDDNKWVMLLSSLPQTYDSIATTIRVLANKEKITLVNVKKELLVFKNELKKKSKNSNEPEQTSFMASRSCDSRRYRNGYQDRYFSNSF